jgi:hypothetical protein
MVSINEELKAAKAAKAAITVLSTTTPKSAVLATLKYNLLLFREAMIGRTDGLIDPTVMARITAREVAAGRMTPDDEMHTLSVAGAEVLGKLPVQKPISVDAPPTPTAHPSMADRLGQVLSWTASRIKSKLRRP